jgi:uncharacterized protein (TIGR01244 family)
MMLRALDDKVSVAPQISTDEMADLKTNGVTTIICNRPDMEVPPDLASTVMADHAKGEGLMFANVPLAPGNLTLETIQAQLAAIDAATGRVLAYCASGTRSAILWAFAMALADRMSTEDILAALDRAGYPSPGLAPQLDQIRAMDT